MGDTATTSVLSVAEPLIWLLSTIPVFTITIHQPPESRLWLLPFLLIPFLRCFHVSNQLTPAFPGVDWLAAFTALIGSCHTTCGLYMECWAIPPQIQTQTRPNGWNLTCAFRSWMNPRRLPLDPRHRSGTTALRRLNFALRQLAHLLLLAAAYVVIENSIALTFAPKTTDFMPARRSYMHFYLDRAALLRATFAFHWAWISYLVLEVAHTLMSVLFVSVIPVDDPDAWPPLFSSPNKIYSLRSFWGGFWHRIGSPSQAAWGRAISRDILKIPPRCGAEKVFLAAWVFAVSGFIHILVNWKTDPMKDTMIDTSFLVVNFAAGLFEFLVVRFMPGLRSCRWTRTKKVLGFLWVWLFFYSVVPQSQYPEYFDTAFQLEQSGRSATGFTSPHRQ